MKNRNLLLFASFLVSLSIQAQNIIKLSELDLSKGVQDYGKIQIGKTVTGEPARIKNCIYNEVIGTHAKSVLKINLHGDALRLKSQIGVAESSIDLSDKSLITLPLVDGTKLYFRNEGDDKQFLGAADTDGKIDRGSVCFIVKGDGKEIYNSGIIHADDSPASIDVSLEGVHMVELIAEPTNDGVSGDNALWIDPTIAYNSVLPETVDAEYTGEGPKMATDVLQRLSDKIKGLPVWSEPASTQTSFDWLVTPEKAHSGIYASEDGKSIVVANPMVSRTFRVFPNLATTDYINRMTGESMLRAVSSEGHI